MPGSFSSGVSRLASVARVGALSGVPAVRLPTSEQAASAAHNGRSARLRLLRIVAAPGNHRAVDQLGDREPRLRRVDGEAFLLLHELGHGQVLYLPLLLAAQRRDLRDEAADTLLELRDARRELLEARRLVALRLHERV